VESGEVTLEGTVESKQARRIAEDLIEDVVGVKDVDNKLKLKRPGAETAGGSDGREGQQQQTQPRGGRGGQSSRRASS
jgi:hypothetical protein